MTRPSLPFVLVFCILHFAFCLPLLADLTPDQSKQAQSLIDQFTSPDFATRQQATDKLVAMGIDVLPLVRKALAETKDPEATLRCQLVLRGVKLQEKRVEKIGTYPPDLVKSYWVTLSPDGSRIAYQYQVNNGMKGILVVGGQIVAGEESPHDMVVERSFPPDGKRFAYVLKQYQDGRPVMWVVTDAKEEPRYNEIQRLTFSPDGRHLAYVAGASVGLPNQMSWTVVCDSKEGIHYNGSNARSLLSSITFSPDGKHLAYVVLRPVGGDMVKVVVCDGVEGPQYDDARGLCFTPDSKHLVYWARRGDKFSIVRDEREEPAFPTFDLTLSPDGEHLAYTCWLQGKGSIVIDGKKEWEHDVASISPPVFSPDGKHLAFFVCRQTKWALVCDGKEGQASYDDPGEGFGPIFSPEGQHLVRRAARDSSVFVVCDGLEAPPHENVWIRPGFSKVPGKVRYAVADNGEVWLVEVDWPTNLDWSNGLNPMDR